MAFMAASSAKLTSSIQPPSGPGFSSVFLCSYACSDPVACPGEWRRLGTCFTTLARISPVVCFFSALWFIRTHAARPCRCRRLFGSCQKSAISCVCDGSGDVCAKWCRVASESGQGMGKKAWGKRMREGCPLAGTCYGSAVMAFEL